MYRTRVVTRYPCIMIISHLDALNPAACHRPVPSCTIFSRSGLPQGRRPRPPCACPASSFTGALRHKNRKCNTAVARRPDAACKSGMARVLDATRREPRRRELVSRGEWDASVLHAVGALGNSSRLLPRLPPLSRLQLPPTCSVWSVPQRGFERRRFIGGGWREKFGITPGTSLEFVYRAEKKGTE